MSSIVFFNNKGGVGKTTLVCNVAAYMALRRGLKVLLVDCDPQCNSTQLILSSDRWMSLYWEPTGRSPKTLIDVLSPIDVGEASIRDDVMPLRGTRNRFGVDLLPGHPRMSIIEDRLSKAWGDLSGGDIGGIRITNWVTNLARVYGARYDVIFFDVGPSLGSLNRTVLLGADYFVTPMGADIFSVVAIRNIAEWLSSWLEIYRTGLHLCETSRHPGMLARYDINANNPQHASFAGYTVQQYITKSKQGVRRPTEAFEQILSRVPEEIEKRLGPLLASHLTPADAKLGDVPNMFSLIPLAQSVNAPIAELRSSDGLVGGQYRQQANYAATIEAMSKVLAINVGLPEAGRP
jgi:cellulose biosynthesis protein BcsQ